MVPTGTKCPARHEYTFILGKRGTCKVLRRGKYMRTDLIELMARAQSWRFVRVVSCVELCCSWLVWRGVCWVEGN